MRQEKRKKKGEERAKLLSLLTPQNICKILLSAHARTSQANRELKQRRFWATHVNRKWGPLPFYIPRHWQICIAKCLFSYKEDLRVSTEPLLNDAKSPLPVDVRCSKTLLLKLPNILHLYQKASKCMTCKWLYGKFWLFIARQWPENCSTSFKRVFWQNFQGQMG